MWHKNTTNCVVELDYEYSTLILMESTIIYYKCVATQLILPWGNNKWVKIRLIKLLSTYVVYWTWFLPCFYVSFYYIFCSRFFFILHSLCWCNDCGDKRKYWNGEREREKKMCVIISSWFLCVDGVWNSLKNYAPQLLKHGIYFSWKKSRHDHPNSFVPLLFCIRSTEWNFHTHTHSLVEW